MTEELSGQQGITLRLAVQRDARSIGAVFDAAVRVGWTYLGDLAATPMFTRQDWEQLVSDNQPPNALLVAVDKRTGWWATPSPIPKTARCSSCSSIPRTPVAGSAELFSTAPTTRCARPDARRHICSCTSQNERALAVSAAAGYRPDGSDRVSDFRGTPIRELRLVKPLRT